MQNLIEDNKSLKEFIAESQNCKILALDTEFFRRYSYYPKLCLIQVNNGTKSVAIDTLTDIDLAPLLELIMRDDIVKIFHGARQDLEIFYSLIGDIPKPIYDTQIMALATGFQTPPSYEKIVKALLGKEINKSLQNDDWRIRPLSENHLDYALSDVIYLLPLYQRLYDRLEKNNRLDWIKDEIDFLENAANYQPDFDNLWSSVKGLKKNKPKTLAVLKEITAAREKLAMKYNVLRKHISDDSVLLKIAERPVKSIEELKKRNILTMKLTTQEDIEFFFKSITIGTSQEKINLMAQQEKPERPNTQEKIQIDILKILRQITAEQLNISPRLLGGSELLYQFVSGGALPDYFQTGWRYEHFGKILEQFASGKSCIQNISGKIMLLPHPPETPENS